MTSSISGSDTRYHVELDAGGSLVVIKQNVATSSTEALAQKGRSVRLIWEGRHALPLGSESASSPDGQVGTAP